MTLTPIANINAQLLEEAVVLYLDTAHMSTSSYPNASRQDALNAFAEASSIWYIHYDDERVKALIGFEKINPIDRIGEPFISITPECQRQGLGTQLGQGMLDLAWNVLNFRRLQALILSDAPSRKLLETYGFTLEGTMRSVRYKNGEYKDVLVYGLLREE